MKVITEVEMCVLDAWVQSSPSNLKKHVEVSKLCFPKKSFFPKKCIHYYLLLELCNILAECTRLSAKKISDINLNIINIFVGIINFVLNVTNLPKSV